jgi:uncharacterized protein YndB with AHSA1/START domain
MVAHVTRKRNFELRYASGQMIPSQIEKEILIEAPIDVVWRVVTEPDQIKQWFCTDAELDGRAGGAGRMAFEHGYTYFLEIVVFEPPSRFAYRWIREQAIKAGPENSTLVEFTLQAEAGNTRLRVVESGFDKVDWTDEAKVKYMEENSSGWLFYLGRLRDYAPRSNTAARR